MPRKVPDSDYLRQRAVPSNPNGDAKKWYDDVVAATKYIGPVAK